MTALSVTPAHAAFDAFLKIDGVEGESTSERHRDQIEVYSFSWGLSNPAAIGSGGGGGAGKANLQEFTITKGVDKSTPKLFLRTAVGEPLGTAVLRVADSRGDDRETSVFYEIVLEDVYVTSVDSNARARDGELTENITLNFSRVEFRFSNRDESGGYLDIEKDPEPVTATIVNPERETDG